MCDEFLIYLLITNVLSEDKAVVNVMEKKCALQAQLEINCIFLLNCNEESFWVHIEVLVRLANYFNDDGNEIADDERTPLLPHK